MASKWGAWIRKENEDWPSGAKCIGWGGEGVRNINSKNDASCSPQQKKEVGVVRKFRFGDLLRLPVDITGQGGGPVIMIKSSRRKDKVL